MSAKRLECIEIRVHGRRSLSDVHPGTRRRTWMDQTNGAFAYRCVPLVMANVHGWEIRCPEGFSAVWDGNDEPEAIAFSSDDSQALPVETHFGHGILTFPLEVIFRTDPGTALWVSGPPNAPKDAIQPLTGLVETDWMPFSFTMNWKFTRAHTPIRFEAGEPFCQVFPIQPAALEDYQPITRRLTEADPYHGQFSVAYLKRTALETVKAKHGVTIEELRYQRWYAKGEMPDGSAKAPNHRNDLNIKPFARKDD